MSNKYTKTYRSRHHMQCLLALGLAFGLGAGACGATPPEQVATGSPNLFQQAIESLASSGITLPAEILAARSAASPQTEVSTSGYTFYVQNCDDSGAGSLRQKVLQASDGDIVDLGTLTCSTILLTDAIDVHQANLTIIGALTQSGDAVPTIDAQNLDQVFLHRTFGNPGTLTLRAVTIINGYDDTFGGGCIQSSASVKLIDAVVNNCSVVQTDPIAGIEGGAIRALDEVTLIRSGVGNGSLTSSIGYVHGGGIWAGNKITMQDGSIVAYNEAIGGSGGYARGGGLATAWNHGYIEVVNSIIMQNTVSNTDTYADGGGAYAYGYSTIWGSFVYQNKCLGTGNKAFGGGLFLAGGGQLVKGTYIFANHADSAGGGLYVKNDILVQDSSISGNDAIRNAGALWALHSADIENSTIAGNTADLGVGGISIGGTTTEPSTIVQSTIALNEADDSSNGAGVYLRGDAVIMNSTITGNKGSMASQQDHGMGIALADGVSLEMTSTIVSANTANQLPSDIGMAFSGQSATIDGHHDLIGYSTESLASLGYSISSNQPQLGTLQDNGGRTATMLPLPNSPAIYAGYDNFFQWDQRGAGFTRTGWRGTDIGAAQRDGDGIFADGFDPNSPI